MVLILTVASATWVAYSFSKAESEQNYKESVNQQLALVDEAIEMYVSNIRANTEMIAELPSVKQIDSRITSYLDKTGPNGLVPMLPYASDPFEAEIYDLLGTFKSAHASIKNASIGVQENGGFIKYPASPRFDGYDARERSWYLSAVENPKKVVVSGIYTTSTNEKVILSVRTIHNRDDEMVGVVTVDFDLNALSETVNQITIGKEGYIVLVDREGVVLAHPNSLSGSTLHPKQKPLVGLNLMALGFNKAMSEDFSQVKVGRFSYTNSNNVYAVEVIPSKMSEIGIHYVVVVPQSEFSQSAWRIGERLFWFSLPLSAVAILIGTWLTSRLVKPLVKLKEWSAAMAVGQLDLRVDLSRDDELGQLANQFNQMAEALQKARENLEERVAKRTAELSDANQALWAANQELMATLDLLQATQQHLIQSAKLAGLGSMVAGIAHEINTPLGIAITMVSYMEMALAEPLIQVDKLKECNDILQRNLKRTSALIERFKLVTIDQVSEVKRSFNMSDFLHELIETLQYDANYRMLNIDWHCPQEIFLNSYPGSWSLAISQLLENVVNHAYLEGEACAVNLKIGREGGTLVLTCTDFGKGIGQESLNRIFEPFYTTQRLKGSTGLGLFVVHNVVTLQLGGTVEVQSELGKGTAFTICVPC